MDSRKDSTLSSLYSCFHNLIDNKKRLATDDFPNVTNKIGRFGNISDYAPHLDIHQYQLQPPIQELQPSPSVESTIKADNDTTSLKDKRDLQGKPKRPLSGYNIFFREERQKILASIPSSKDDETEEGTKRKRRKSSKKKRTPHGKIGFENLGKQIGHNWRNLDQDSATRYRKLAALDMVRYRGEMKEWTLRRNTKKEEVRSDSPQSHSLAPIVPEDTPSSAAFQRRRTGALEMAQDQRAVAMASLNAEMSLAASRASLINNMAERVPGGGFPHSRSQLETLIGLGYGIGPPKSYGSDSLGREDGMTEARAYTSLLMRQAQQVRRMGHFSSFGELSGLGHLSGVGGFQDQVSSAPHASSIEGISAPIFSDLLSHQRQQNMVGSGNVDIGRFLLQRNIRNHNSNLSNILSSLTTSLK